VEIKLTTDAFLLVCLTAGQDKTFPSRPDALGIQRLEALAEESRRKPEAKIALIGGYKDINGYSLAERYFVWLNAYYPDIAKKVIVVDGRTDNTRDDLKSLREWIGDGPVIKGMVSTHEAHYNRIKGKLRECRFDFDLLPSGEDGSIFGLLDKIMCIWDRFASSTRKIPFLKRFVEFGDAQLRARALVNANTSKEETRLFRVKYPQADADYVKIAAQVREKLIERQAFAG
jgi:hypothetical protein